MIVLTAAPASADDSCGWTTSQCTGSRNKLDGELVQSERGDDWGND